MLEQRPADAELTALADEMVQGSTVKFWSEKYQLTNETLACDLSRPDDDLNEDFCYLGHGIESQGELPPPALSHALLAGSGAHDWPWRRC